MRCDNSDRRVEPNCLLSSLFVEVTLNIPNTGLLCTFVVLVSSCSPPEVSEQDTWTEQFLERAADLRSVGWNPYFILEPGREQVLTDGDEQLTITVLDETRMIDGVETRVVEERETVGGEIREVSRNFFAISQRTNSVYYFGEEVDIYQDGVVTGHEGAWLAGDAGAHLGLMMPGLATLGSRYYQEVAPGVAMDRAQILRLDDVAETPAGRFVDVLVVEETTPLEPGVRELKYYGWGVGLLQDGNLRLQRFQGS